VACHPRASGADGLIRPWQNCYDSFWLQYLPKIAAAPGNRFALIEFVKNDKPENFLQDAAALKKWLQIIENKY
jgi:hypothetical protein